MPVTSATFLLQMSSGREHRGNWNFVGRDVVVLHRLPDSAHCPAGTAADAFVRSAGVRHVVDHDQPRDPVGGAARILCRVKRHPSFE